MPAIFEASDVEVLGHRAMDNWYTTVTLRGMLSTSRAWHNS